MSYRRDDARLTHRTGYPSRPASHLDVPMADEYSPYSSGDDSFKGGGGKKKKKGRSLKKDNALVRAVKEASFYTRATYAWLFVSVMLCYMGYRSIRNNAGSVWLDCTSHGCVLHISPPRRGKRTEVRFDRNQIVRADVVKVDGEGTVRNTERVTSVRDSWSPPAHGKYNKGKYDRYKSAYKSADLGPDEDGLYESYVLVLKEEGKAAASADDGGGASSTDPDAQRTQTGGGGGAHNLSPLFAVAEPNDLGEYHVDMRMFNRGQTRRRAHSMVTRINSYTSSRRHKLTVRENRNVPWQGVVSVVVGILSLLLSLLFGQFWEPEEEPPLPPVRRARGTLPAGGRRRQQAPTGYGSYGGYRPQQAQRTSTLSSQSRAGAAGPSGPRGGPTGYGTYGGYKPQQSGRR